MKERIALVIMLLTIFLIHSTGFTQTISEYLILQDIGSYKLDRPEKIFAGEPPIGGPREYDSSGILAGAGHMPDHLDKTYEVMYIGGDELPSPTVQVTQHAGSESDRWLLHEVERGFRRGEYEENMTSARFRSIEGNNIFYSGLGGGTYRWVSNNVVINIEYTDLYKEKPEPIEVVRAYLRKFPSTIPDMTIDRAHNEKWIKDEMERRLWLCDKWFYQLQLKKVELRKTLREVVDHLNVFLDYRERYYGVKATDEKNLLWEYLQANDGTSIKRKLKEFKDWWSNNKEKAIGL